MKMTSLQRNKVFYNKGRADRSVIFSVSATIFFIIIFSLSWTRNLLFNVGTPLWIVKNEMSSFFFDNIGLLNSKNSLLKENFSLKQKIKSDEKNQALFDLLKKENDEFKNILNNKGNYDNLLLAAVLVKPFFSPYDTIIIDVGASSGVEVGDEVLADGDSFIGYISEVFQNTSKIILYSSPGEKVKVLIGSNNVEKEAVGLGGGNFSVQIPRETDIKVGDSIVIPSVSTNIFGVVEKIEFKESDSFQNVLFKNPTNIEELKWVEVLLSNKN